MNVDVSVESLSPHVEADLSPVEAVIDSNQEAASSVLVQEAIVESNSDTTAASHQRWQFWQVFSSTFLTIFLAELGDKTQVSTLLLSAEFHNPWVIFAGSALALIATSLLGVLVGRWLASHISPALLDKAAGVIMALISVWLLLEVIQG
ncbi:MAG TPA: TMEM165/GDT1 family protein [Leptolyngbyaceae cyanobacterium M33_DOE_097]|uniref:GDT1 family protein n=1 Tax=Oscillatoriales cyanobacterium SpSt-418 TaxID=2282169 RepID=A0A7C3PDB7_9CYAN|nr:TMEM165/GDT1 family protein [Leptolyngbyaceae cyanobacterium M33_DOE_097]